MGKRDIRNTNLRQFPETTKEDVEVIWGEDRWMAIYLMGQGRNLYSSTEEYSASGSFIIPSHGDNFFLLLWSLSVGYDLIAREPRPRFFFPKEIMVKFLNSFLECSRKRGEWFLGMRSLAKFNSMEGVKSLSGSKGETWGTGGHISMIRYWLE